MNGKFPTNCTTDYQGNKIRIKKVELKEKKVQQCDFKVLKKATIQKSDDKTKTKIRFALDSEENTSRPT